MKFERFVDKVIAVSWTMFKIVAVAVGVVLVVSVALYVEMDAL